MREREDSLGTASTGDEPRHRAIQYRCVALQLKNAVLFPSHSWSSNAFCRISVAYLAQTLPAIFQTTLLLFKRLPSLFKRLKFKTQGPGEPCSLTSGASENVAAEALTAKIRCLLLIDHWSTSYLPPRRLTGFLQDSGGLCAVSSKCVPRKQQQLLFRGKRKTSHLAVNGIKANYRLFYPPPRVSGHPAAELFLVCKAESVRKL